MKVAQVTVPLTALLVYAAGTAVASPLSALDPYSNVKAPSTKAKLAQPTVNSKPVKLPPTQAAAAPVFKTAEKSTPINDQVESTGGGFLAGTKQILHGFGTATKGAASDIVHPAKSIGGGMVNGSKKVTHGMVEGAKNTGELVSKSAKKMGDGVKAGAGKVKDGTMAAGKAVSAVPEKMGEGLKSTGDKVKEGGGGMGSKLVAMPKAIGKGIFGAASKTGEATKKVAGAPLRLAGKLNPFHHKGADGTATAAQPSSAQQ